jgi:hypothetical protein
MMMQMMMHMMRGRGGGEDAPGMGMGGRMMPEMMQQMPGMMGRRGAPDEPRGMGMGPGEGMGPGMMEDCPVMTMMGMQRGGMGPRMGGMKADAGGALLAGPRHAPEEMTPERVRAWVEERLEWIGNPRLALGDVETAADGSIIAEIVTADGSLVQKLAFNRYPGLFRVVTE